jgi:hypothetical protein
VGRIPHLVAGLIETLPNFLACLVQTPVDLVPFNATETTRNKIQFSIALPSRA